MDFKGGLEYPMLFSSETAAEVDKGIGFSVPANSLEGRGKEQHVLHVLREHEPQMEQYKVNTAHSRGNATIILSLSL